MKQLRILAVGYDYQQRMRIAETLGPRFQYVARSPLLFPYMHERDVVSYTAILICADNIDENGRGKAIATC